MAHEDPRQISSTRQQGWPQKSLALLAAALLVALTLGLAAQRNPSDRDKWQRPQEIMDALGLRAGSPVAHIGAGPGYITFHFAERVGAQGTVYAADIRKDRLKKSNNLVS